ncbi:MAG: hypothetical protein SOT76_04555 [Eubacteriales bacterium]|nr:hypothetical protein [bacterium]MDY2791993.1 hypothetical protein [Eubacteriales bacterium]
MVFLKRRTKRNYAVTPKKTRLYLQIAAACVLLFVAIFALVSRGNALRRLDKTREALTASIQDNMNQVLNQYDSMARKNNTAIAEDILPGMQQHMYAARTLNTLLTESFGEKYAVLTPELYSSFEEAVAAYEKQISMGQSTADAAERMTRCMTGIETALNDRFGKDGLLSPRTALK